MNLRIEVAKALGWKWVQRSNREVALLFPPTTSRLYVDALCAGEELMWEPTEKLRDRTLLDKWFPNRMCSNEESYTIPRGKDYLLLPDYPHDIGACFMDLVPSLPNLDISERQGQWMLWTIKGEEDFQTKASTLAEAICKAFLEVMSKDEE